jgi:hypothetical protein
MNAPEPRSVSVSALSVRARAAVAVFCIGFGLFVCAAAMRWIAVPLARGVPFWIAGLAGAVFVLAGIAVALPQHTTRLQDLLGALLFTAFATIGIWAGFGPGQRNFSGGTSVGPLTFGGESNEMVGRILFGAMGILVALIAVKAWRRLTRPRDEDQAQP